MNDFWDNLSKAVNDAACMAIKVSGDAVELTKTSLNIKFDEIKRDSFFKEIGRAVYEAYKANPESAGAEVLDFCKCIDELEDNIGEQKVKAAGIKNKKFCVNCGVQLLKSVNYCYSCGAKQPVIVEDGCCCDDEPDCCPSDDDKCCDGDSCDVNGDSDENN